MLIYIHSLLLNVGFFIHTDSAVFLYLICLFKIVYISSLI